MKKKSSYQKMTEIADAEVNTTFCKENGITQHRFHVNGIAVSCQENADNCGIYGVSIDTIDELAIMLGKGE